MINRIDGLRTETDIPSFTLSNEQVYETARNLGLNAYDCTYVGTERNNIICPITAR